MQRYHRGQPSSSPLPEYPSAVRRSQCPFSWQKTHFPGPSWGRLHFFPCPAGSYPSGGPWEELETFFCRLKSYADTVEINVKNTKQRKSERILFIVLCDNKWFYSLRKVHLIYPFIKYWVFTSEENAFQWQKIVVQFNPTINRCVFKTQYQIKSVKFSSNLSTSILFLKIRKI